MKRFILALLLAFCGSVIAGQPLKTDTATEIMVDLLDTAGDPVESLTTIGDLHIRLFTIAYNASTVTMAAEINPTADGGSVNDLVHEADGMWTFELAAANINFVGRLNVSISDPDNDDFVPWSKSFEVYSAVVFDGMFGATTAAAAALTAYDPPTDTEMLAAHTTTDTAIGTAQTDLDTLTDPISEQAQGAPPNDPTLAEAVSYLYMYLFRNKRETTATTDKIYDDATGATVVFQTEIDDDKTTFTRAKYTGGP